MQPHPIIILNIYLTGSYKSKSKKLNRELEFHGWSPYIFEAVSYNGLFYFLLANLLTGVINFTVETVRSSDSVALFVLLGYVLVTHFTVVMLYKRKLKVNFF